MLVTYRKVHGPVFSITRIFDRVLKFLLSMGPFSTGVKGQFYIDHKDDAVRPALVMEGGQMMWPAPPLVLPVDTSKKVRGRRGVPC